MAMKWSFPNPCNKYYFSRAEDLPTKNKPEMAITMVSFLLMAGSQERKTINDYGNRSIKNEVIRP
jgi:hypothetical protein